MDESHSDASQNNLNKVFSVTSLSYTDKHGKAIPVFPYVIAFSGHRDFAKPGELPDFCGYTEEDIKARFKEELFQLAKLWEKKSAGSAPLILLTGLADGTDQIIAQAAIELKKDNVKVIAVLPMERSCFELTLLPENRKNYQDLLNQVDAVYELPLAKDVVGHEEELKLLCEETEIYRQIQYRLQAQFISLHSHIHFVCWDGVNIDSKGGGTSETVMFKLEGNSQQTEGNILTFSSIGPVVQFLLPRNNKANKSVPFAKGLNWNSIPTFYWTRDKLRQLGKTQPDRSVMNEANRLQTSVAKCEEVVQVLTNIGSLNKEGSQLFQDNSPENEEQKQQSWDRLFGIGSTPEEKVPETAQRITDTVKHYLDSGSNVFIDHYIIADMLASKFQDKMKNNFKWYARTAFVFFLCSGLLSLLKGFTQYNHSILYTIFSWLFGLPYELALIVAVGILIYSHCKTYHYKYYYYRAIAEALRIQIFWRIASMSGCVSGYYRSHQIYKTEWLRAAINSLDVLIESPQEESNDVRLDRIDFVKNIWIKEQQEFFTTKITQKRKKTRIDYFTHPYAMIAFSVMILALAPFFDFLQESIVRYCNGSICCLAVYCLCHILITVLIAMYISFSIKTQTPIEKEEANRYEREIFPFDRAMLLLSKNLTANPAEEIEVKQNILRQLGEEALAGNSDWLLSVDKRSLTMNNVKLDKE